MMAQIYEDAIMKPIIVNDILIKRDQMRLLFLY